MRVCESLTSAQKPLSERGLISEAYEWQRRQIFASLSSKTAGVSAVPARDSISTIAASKMLSKESSVSVKSFAGPERLELGGVRVAVTSSHFKNALSLFDFDRAHCVRNESNRAAKALLPRRRVSSVRSYRKFADQFFIVVCGLPSAPIRKLTGKSTRHLPSVPYPGRPARPARFAKSRDIDPAVASSQGRQQDHFKR